MRTPVAALALLALVGCATLSRDSFDERFGAADPHRYDQPAAPAPGGVSWRADVQPILQRRCVVCHGCYDAPCQLKLSAWQGVARGASGENVYDTERGCARPRRRGCSSMRSCPRSGVPRASSRC